MLPHIPYNRKFGSVKMAGDKPIVNLYFGMPFSILSPLLKNRVCIAFSMLIHLLITSRNKIASRKLYTLFFLRMRIDGHSSSFYSRILFMYKVISPYQLIPVKVINISNKYDYL